MAKTRGAKATTKDSIDESSNGIVPKKTPLGPESQNPPRVFILPEGTSPEARIITLQNPRYANDSRYLVCPEKGFFEFTKIAAPKTIPRSWLLSTEDEVQKFERNGADILNEKAQDGQDDISKGYVMSAADMFLATAIDPLFLILPALSPKPSGKSTESESKLFLSAEDYNERITSVSPQLKTLLRIESLRTRLESRMAAACDMVDAGDESMYRINNAKLLGELWSKAKKMAQNGLPESMEEKFIRKPLEVPMLSIKRDESFLHELRKGEEEADSGISTPNAETADSQSSVSTTATSITEASTAATSFSSEDNQTPTSTPRPTATTKPPPPLISAPEGVPTLLRLRTAFTFILSAYIPPHLHTPLTTLLTTTTSLADFSPLDAHLTHLRTLRQEALAARNLNDMSKKRALDDEEDEIRAEKKRKVEEEEKRKKAGESRAVKNLKKVNVSGMKKMSDFFKKKV